jgi:hypothetical protein
MLRPTQLLSVLSTKNFFLVHAITRGRFLDCKVPNRIRWRESLLGRCPDDSTRLFLRQRVYRVFWILWMVIVRYVVMGTTYQHEK